MHVECLNQMDESGLSESIFIDRTAWNYGGSINNGVTVAQNASDELLAHDACGAHFKKCTLYYGKGRLFSRKLGSIEMLLVCLEPR